MDKASILNIILPIWGVISRVITSITDPAKPFRNNSRQAIYHEVLTEIDRRIANGRLSPDLRNIDPKLLNAVLNAHPDVPGFAHDLEELPPNPQAAIVNHEAAASTAAASAVQSNVVFEKALAEMAKQNAELAGKFDSLLSALGGNKNA